MVNTIPSSRNNYYKYNNERISKEYQKRSWASIIVRLKRVCALQKWNGGSGNPNHEKYNKPLSRRRGYFLNSHEEWCGHSCNDAVSVPAAPRLLLVGGNRGGVCDDAVSIATASGFLLVGRCFDDDGGDGGECVHYGVGGRSVGERDNQLRLEKKNGAGFSSLLYPGAS